jgi:NADPH:quinone reductase-like Zn-dependent oxidoreductase
MKAIVQDAYGAPDLLELREIDAPTIGDRDVLVRVRAASVHPDVWHMVRGVPRVLRVMGAGVRRPKRRVPGTDLAGIVDSVGTSVTRFRPGDEVFGKTVAANSWRNGGAYADLAAAHQDRLEPKPPSISFEQAAASPDSGTIAIQGLRDEGRLRAGQRVLINGAGGGVGTFAVQIAKAMGADVTAVDVPEKLDMLRSIGADRVIDAAREDFTRGVEGYDLVLDIPGNHPFSEIRRVLTPSGTYVLIGHDAYGRLGRRWIGSLGRFLRLLVLSLFVKQLPGLRGAKDPGDRLRVLRELLEEGKVSPVIDRTFPLAEVPAAIRHLAEGRVRGKVVITIGS